MAMAAASAGVEGKERKDETKEEGSFSAPLTIPNDKDEIRYLRKSIDELQRRFQEQLDIQKQQVDILKEIAAKGTRGSRKTHVTYDEAVTTPKWNTIDPKLQEELFVEVKESRVPNQENLSRILDRLGAYGDSNGSDRSFQDWTTAEDKESLALTPTVGTQNDITWDSSFKDLSRISKELYAEILKGGSPERNWGLNLDSNQWTTQIWRRTSLSDSKWFDVKFFTNFWETTSELNFSEHAAQSNQDCHVVGTIMRISDQESMSFKEFFTALLSLQYFSREQDELEKDRSPFRHAMGIFLNYWWGWRSADNKRGQVTYWLDSVALFSDKYISSSCRFEFPSKGSALYFLCHFQLRALSLVEDKNSKDSVFPGIRMIRQSGRFFNSETQGSNYVLCEERKAVAACVHVNVNGANQYNIVVLGGKKKDYEYSTGLPATGSLTGLSMFVEEFDSILRQCCSSWSKILDQLDKEIGVPVSFTNETSTLESLMFDKGTLGRSKLYFAYLQQLRIFVEWINETKADLSSFMDSYASWSGLLFESSPKESLPSLQVLISQEERDWMLRHVQKSVDEYTTSFTGLLDRIDKKKNEIESLREGLFNATSIQDARNSAQLNYFVLVFTVMTVIYLPLDFVTSFSGMHVFDDPSLVTSRHQFFLTLAIALAATYGPFALGVPVYAYAVWGKRKSNSTEKPNPDEKKQDIPSKKNISSVTQKSSVSASVNDAPDTTAKGEKKPFTLSGLFKRKSRQKNTDNTRTTQIV